MPMAELYQKALAKRLIGLEVLRNPDKARNPDPNARCEFYLGAPGHSTENYYRLRLRLQDLIDHKMLILNAVPSPNVNLNPMPNHRASLSQLIDMYFL